LQEEKLSTVKRQPYTLKGNVCPDVSTSSDRADHRADLRHNRLAASAVVGCLRTIRGQPEIIHTVYTAALKVVV
jgi:hypothetical protein